MIPAAETAYNRAYRKGEHTGAAPTVSVAEAKPCPFCGVQPTIQPWHGGGPQKRLIECGNDHCYMQPSITGETRKLALAYWNWRYTDER